MAESPEQLWERVSGSLQMPPVEEWDSWPFHGELRPRALERPVERERLRNGEGGVDCRACGRGDDTYHWTNERWRLYALPPTGCRSCSFWSHASTSTHPATSRRTSLPSRAS